MRRGSLEAEGSSPCREQAWSGAWGARSCQKQQSGCAPRCPRPRLEVPGTLVQFLKFGRICPSHLVLVFFAVGALAQIGPLSHSSVQCPFLGSVRVIRLSGLHRDYRFISTVLSHPYLSVGSDFPFPVLLICLFSSSVCSLLLLQQLVLSDLLFRSLFHLCSHCHFPASASSALGFSL